MAYTEEEPLLKPQAQQVTGDVALVQPEAQWDSGLLACCGNGDLQGCATFSLVHVFPCVAFGGCLSISPRISRATTLVKKPPIPLLACEMHHRSRIQPSLVTLVPPWTMMLRRACYVVTSMLCQALVKAPPHSLYCPLLRST